MHKTLGTEWVLHEHGLLSFLVSFSFLVKIPNFISCAFSGRLIQFLDGTKFV